MLWYFAKLLLLLPVLGLLIWGSLRLTKSVQKKLGTAPAAGRSIRLKETSFVAPGIKLAVVEFRGREILLGCTRHGLTRLADVPAAAEFELPEPEQDSQ